MYEWVPYLHGKYYTYTDYAAGAFFALFTVLGVLNWLIAALIKFCVKVEHSDVPEHLLQLEAQYDYLTQPRPGYPVARSKPYYGSHSLNYLENQVEESGIANFLISFFSWLSTFFFALTPVGLSFFGVLLTPLVAAILMLAILFIKTRSGYHAKVKKLYQTLRQTNTIAYAEEVTSARSSYRFKLLGFAILSLVSSYALSGGCVAIYEDFVGLRIESLNLSLSSTLSRYFQLQDACPPGPPCHVYATLPEDATTAVFINAHTNVEHENVVITYDTKDHFTATRQLRYNVNANTMKLDYLEQRGRRAVHSALVDQLTPETTYVMQIIYDDKVHYTFDYVTLPGKDSQKNIVIATGGDLGDRDVAQRITFQAGAVGPDLIVIGGDVSYDDGIHNCYFTWDNFFNSFTLATLTSGRLIPFLFSVGNHDVGMNSMSGRDLKITEKGPLYAVFLPQNTVPGFDANENPINKVPSLSERPSYHYHVFGNVLHLNLDTGYLTNPADQADFITTLSTAFPDYIKMVSSHNPIYHACDGGRDEAEQEAHDTWVPLFDKYKFMAIFENHEHAFKKTFPLTGGVPTAKGTYYLGNGNWGANPGTPTCKPNNATGILEYQSRINHYWLANVSMSQGVIQYTAYGATGVPLIPTFEQDVADYMLD